ncbi:MAG: hypothetical protein ACREL5_01935 [Gemmatimonadales bacterium]
MFHFIGSLFSLIGFVVTVVAGIFAFGVAREFVRNRLRFVDSVRNPVAPWLVFIGAFIILLPVVAILPLVGAGSALLVGGATGLGTASGVKALKRGE